MRETLTPEQQAEQATNDLRSAMDSVNLINKLVSEGIHSEQFDSRVQSNYQHLEIVLARENVIADSSDKTPYLQAIESGKAFAPTV
jgi:hypothetical protein